MEIDCVNRYFDAWNARDADAILASLSPHGTYQDPTTEGPISGEAFRGYLGALWAAFPDLNFETKNVGEVAPGRFAGQWIMRGTNTGSMRGLPPSNKTVEVEGADFFEIDGDRVGRVEGYFDAGAVPRQIGLNVIARPYAIGPFRFGDATAVQTGKTQKPGAFSVTYLEAADEASSQTVKDLSRDALVDMLHMDGFIGATTASFGTRMLTISAWDTPEDSRKVMSEGAHSAAMKQFYSGALSKGGFTSVWTAHRINPFFTRCDSLPQDAHRRAGRSGLRLRRRTPGAVALLVIPVAAGRSRGP